MEKVNNFRVMLLTLYVISITIVPMNSKYKLIRTENDFKSKIASNKSKNTVYSDYHVDVTPQLLITPPPPAPEHLPSSKKTFHSFSKI